MPTRIRQNSTHRALVLLVVDTVTDNSIPGPLILVRHRTGWLPPPIPFQLRGRVTGEPAQMLLAAVRLFCPEPMAELNTEIDAEGAQPLVMLQALTDPNGARVLRIADRQVAALRGRAFAERCSGQVRFYSGSDGQNPVRSIEQLRSLQNHFDHMLIAVPARTARRLLRQKEDVHVGAL